MCVSLFVCVQIRGQLVGASSLLPPCRSRSQTQVSGLAAGTWTTQNPAWTLSFPVPQSLLMGCLFKSTVSHRANQTLCRELNYNVAGVFKVIRDDKLTIDIPGSASIKLPPNRGTLEGTAAAHQSQVCEERS